VRVEIIVMSVVITIVRVTKSQCMWKLHSMCINHTHIYTHRCQNYSRVSGNHTLRVKSHSVCGDRSLRVEINLVHVEITLLSIGITFVPVETTLRVEITLERVEITLMSVIFTCIRVKLTLVCAESSACGNITVRVETNLVRIENTLLRVANTLCVYKFHSVCRNYTLCI
jgi:hypothetical protein